MEIKVISPLVGLCLLLLINYSPAQVTNLSPDTTQISFVFSQNLGYGESLSIPLGDIDSDGDSDAVVINYQELSSVWINNGNGVFSSAQVLGSLSGHGGALGDLDGDDDLDLFLVHNMTYDKIFLNNGNGVFTATLQNLGNELDYGIAVVLGDIDNDDDLDALVENYLHLNRVWINDGNGYFTDSGQSLGGEESGSMALGDLDSDDDLDVFVMNNNLHDRVWFNNGNGNFYDSGQNLDSLDGWGTVDLSDLDGDQDLDAFVTNSEHGNKVWFNNGSGVFNQSGPFFGASSQKVKLGDLDRDRDLDAITTHNLLGNSIWINDGTGAFSYAGVNCGSSEGISVALGDADNDGDLDAFIGNGIYSGGTGYAELYLNETVTGINDHAFINPDFKFELYQNYPNPFNPATKIRYVIKVNSSIELKVYDISGREVATLVDEVKPTGEYEIKFDGSQLTSGVYFYQLWVSTPSEKAGNFKQTRKMLLIK